MQDSVAALVIIVEQDTAGRGRGRGGGGRRPFGGSGGFLGGRRL